MCSFAVRIKKLAQIAGEAEHELLSELGGVLHFSNESGSTGTSDIQRARRLLTLRGDSWALASFDRVLQFLKDNPELCAALARHRAIEIPSREQTMQDFLEFPRYPGALLCEEVADLVRSQEEASSG